MTQGDTRQPGDAPKGGLGGVKGTKGGLGTPTDGGVGVRGTRGDSGTPPRGLEGGQEDTDQPGDPRRRGIWEGQEDKGGPEGFEGRSGGRGAAQGRPVRGIWGGTGGGRGMPPERFGGVRGRPGDPQ